MESQTANQEKNWQRWDQRWDTQQNDLAEQFGKPIDQLVLNSNEEYNNKVRFLDLLEKSNPPALDENKRFMVAVRDANIYYAPIGVRHKNVMSAVLYCGVKVRRLCLCPSASPPPSTSPSCRRGPSPHSRRVPASPAWG